MSSYFIEGDLLMHSDLALNNFYINKKFLLYKKVGVSHNMLRHPSLLPSVDAQLLLAMLSWLKHLLVSIFTCQTLP